MAFTSKELHKDLEVFIQRTVQAEELKTEKSIEIALQVLKDIFSRINIHHPRFSSGLTEENGRVKGLHAIDADHMELRVYLDQIELFQIDETSAPKGATFLDVKDDRSKLLCIWSEFITAAGHLSARKIRERFQMILTQTVNRSTWTDRNMHVVAEKYQPRLRINNNLVVDIYPAFRLVGFWPRQGRRSIASNSEIMLNDSCEIDLISKEIGCAQPYSTDRDAWQMDFLTMENAVMNNERRELCFSIVNTIVERCLRSTSCVFDAAVVRTVFLYVCEKHPSDTSWTNEKIPDRINSFLLQIVACLQSKCLPHFYLSNFNLLEGHSTKSTRIALNEAWKLAREFCTNQKFFKAN